MKVLDEREYKDIVSVYWFRGITQERISGLYVDKQLNTQQSEISTMVYVLKRY